MTKPKKIKTTKIRKSSKFGIAKFLVMALVLGGGLVYGIQMVQKNQENRSKATYIVYEADEYGGELETIVVKLVVNVEILRLL